jgi:hypothetical protein
MTRVSSFTPADSMVVLESARAATASARFVRLLEPGGRTVPRTGPRTGVMDRVAMKVPFSRVGIS